MKMSEETQHAFSMSSAHTEDVLHVHHVCGMNPLICVNVGQSRWYKRTEENPSAVLRKTTRSDLKHGEY